MEKDVFSWTLAEEENGAKLLPMMALGISCGAEVAVLLGLAACSCPWNGWSVEVSLAMCQGRRVPSCFKKGDEIGFLNPLEHEEYL